MEEKARASASPPTATVTRSGSKVAATISASRSAQRGVNSDGLTITRLPAASMSTIGPTDRSKGKFHGTMFPMTPLGWYSTNALAVPNIAGSV